MHCTELLAQRLMDEIVKKIEIHKKKHFFAAILTFQHRPAACARVFMKCQFLRLIDCVRQTTEPELIAEGRS